MMTLLVANPIFFYQLPCSPCIRDLHFGWPVKVGPAGILFAGWQLLAAFPGRGGGGGRDAVWDTKKNKVLFPANSPKK